MNSDSASRFLMGVMDSQFGQKWRISPRKNFGGTQDEILWFAVRQLLSSLDIDVAGKKNTFRHFGEEPKPLVK